jgi:uncharacterized protein (DUF58 family)
MSASEPLFDADFLQRLRTLFVRLRRQRQLQKRGVQSTPAAGHTREFKDYRSYAPGDDYRSIDWRLYARLDALWIRIFEEIQEFHVHLVIDTSQSMAEPCAGKRVLALRGALALAYLALVNQHRVSLYRLGDGVQRLAPPRKGQGHIHEIRRLLEELPFGGITNLEAGLRRFRPRRDRRGVVFLLSDLFGRAPAAAGDALLQAAAWPAETHVLQVLDPREERPGFDGEVELVDVETAEARRMWLTRREVEQYAARVVAWREELERLCLQRSVDFVTWRTSLSFEDQFLQLLLRSSTLARL